MEFGAYKSINSGNMWSPINTGLTNTIVLHLAIDPQNPGTLYAGTWGGGGIFKTSNGGTDWSNIGLAFNNSYIFRIAIDPQDPSLLYAATNGGLFKSINGGSEWSEINNGLPDVSMNALSLIPRTRAVSTLQVMEKVFSKIRTVVQSGEPLMRA